jgi:hypothetical protein
VTTLYLADVIQFPFRAELYINKEARRHYSSSVTNTNVVNRDKSIHHCVPNAISNPTAKTSSQIKEEIFCFHNGHLVPWKGRPW